MSLRYLRSVIPVGISRQYLPSLSPVGICRRYLPSVPPVGISRRYLPLVSPVGVGGWSRRTTSMKILIFSSVLFAYTGGCVDLRVLRVCGSSRCISYSTTGKHLRFYCTALSRSSQCPSDPHSNCILSTLYCVYMYQDQSTSAV